MGADEHDAGKSERRLTAIQARERAARACGVETTDLGEAREHAWGWSFVAPPAGPVFVDGKTGLVATSDGDGEVEAERIATLYERGPLGVPPWSPPPKRTWWQALRSVFARRR